MTPLLFLQALPTNTTGAADGLGGFAGATVILGLVAAFIAIVAYREGYARGDRDADALGAHDRGFNAGKEFGLAVGWHDAHRAALEVLKQWPTSRGGKAIAKALAKGPGAPLTKRVTVTGTSNADGAA